MPEPKIFTNEMVTNGAFIYAGNTIVFTAKKIDVAGLENGQTITIQNGAKPPEDFIFVKVRKVSLGWFEVTGQKVQPPQEE